MTLFYNKHILPEPDSSSNAVILLFRAVSVLKISEGGTKMDQFITKFSLEGKKAVVTGGAKGLCRGMAQALHDAGAEVVLLDVLDLVTETAEEMGSQGAPVHAVKGDLSDEGSLAAVYGECLEKLDGHIDILLNGAGIQYRCPAADFPHDRWQKILDINLSAVFYLSQLAGRTMLEQHYGRIINIASAAAFCPQPSFAVYAATKSYVLSLSRALHTELKPGGIIVTAVCPGPVDTEFFRISGPLTDPLKKLTLAKAPAVVHQALTDSRRRKEISIYGISMKAARLGAKTIPHGLILKAEGFMQRRKNREKHCVTEVRKKNYERDKNKFK